MTRMTPYIDIRLSQYYETCIYMKHFFLRNFVVNIYEIKKERMKIKYWIA